MNKKFFSAIALSASVSCALAMGALLGAPELIRTSGNAQTALDGTRQGRNTLLQKEKAASVMAASLPAAEATDNELILIDNLPVSGDKISNYTTLDVNNDRYYWELNGNAYTGEYYFQLDAPYKGEADDWLFIPFEVPDGGGQLQLNMSAITYYSSGTGHNFTVSFGKEATPEAMASVITEVSDLFTAAYKWENAKTLEGDASVSEGGKYWLGIHETSPSGAYSMRLRNVTLTLRQGAAEEIPAGEIFSMHPTEDEFANCTIIDGNNDGCKIVYDVHEGLNGTVYDWPMYYNSLGSTRATDDADEWVITPAVKLSEINRLYSASIEAVSTTTSTRESFEIVMAKSNDIESMRAGQVIMSEPLVSNNDYETFSSKFGITEPGEYYFGIHVNSALANGWRIALRNLIISLTDEDAEIPGTCSALSLTPDPTGALKATVSFTMPETYINGKAIPSSETVEAVITSPAQTLTVSGHPGQKVSSDITTVDGNNIITVTIQNGNGSGMEQKGFVMCGADVPTDPVVTYTVSDDNMSLNLKWEPVTKGANGGIIPQEGLTYNIYTYYTTDQSSQWLLLEEGLTECEYTLQAPTESHQLYQLMVSAKNSKGESMGSIESYGAAMLGRPHQMPLNESFPSKSMTYEGLLIDYPDETYTASWALDAASAVGANDGPENALMCLVVEVGNEGGGYAELPKFSTVGCKKPRIKLTTYISAATPETTVRLHSTEGRGNGVTLGVIDRNSGNGWTEIVYDIPERYYDKQWSVVSLDVDCQIAGQVFVLGQYDIYESVANDLAISRISAPSYIRLGETTPFTVTVQNCGTESVRTPELKTELYSEDGLAAKPELSFTPADLAENEKAVYSGTLNFDRLEQGSSYYSLEVTLPEPDENENNNYKYSILRVGTGNMPIAENFKLTGSDKNVALSWANPYADGMIDKIEGYDHGCYEYQLGDWKNVDFDAAQVYFTETYDIPYAGVPKAFQSINAYLCGMEAMQPPSGDSFLMAFCPVGGTADDWLISPEIKGGSTVSFYLGALSYEFPETLEILASSTDDELDSFSTVVSSYVTADNNWNLITVTLPEDAKYFAIHYASNDRFGIAIDNITYSPVKASVEITGWNVYRDNILIKENIPDLSFTDVIPDDSKTYRYNVAAVGTANGKSMVFPLSNTLEYNKFAAIGNISADGTIRISVNDGILTVDGCEGRTVEITDLRGIKLYSVTDASASVSTSLLPGIYIVTVDGKSQKVIVP